ncbi:hypothetical protein F5878DRAFT_654768 [Lentinula raphanica]|uniref:Uncharacterized protein n=1 Tax=Lentinula raphanica TaxID=153919 RepID=A0AA38NWF5_9AGAR|nr:hypothetical protein F5878DRAFT_654768 [Lentinula raphanica]
MHSERQQINAAYYPSHGYDSADDTDALTHRGNWGIKDLKGARWARRGKITAWGPSVGDWEHLTYSSFVMDRSVTHTFRSNLLDELENATNGLIEGEATMKRAMGRLWQVMSEDSKRKAIDTTIVPKQEDEDMGELNEQDARAKRLARAPDLTPPIHKLFLFQNNSSAYGGEKSHFTTPLAQQENLERAMAVMRELQDDGREYVGAFDLVPRMIRESESRAFPLQRL